mmetsp:Transcript_5224/g.15394  ORF Transcript_5224/g.15394 Transcript_5224/m.15394 type:complete len:205 (+) Transcript_5224:1503-2117(+)
MQDCSTSQRWLSGCRASCRACPRFACSSMASLQRASVAVACCSASLASCSMATVSSVLSDWSSLVACMETWSSSCRKDLSCGSTASSLPTDSLSLLSRSAPSFSSSIACARAWLATACSAPRLLWAIRSSSLWTSLDNASCSFVPKAAACDCSLSSSSACLRCSSASSAPESPFLEAVEATFCIASPGWPPPPPAAPAPAPMGA